MTLLLALDVGTTSVKAGLFKPDGCALALAQKEYGLISNSADEAELEPATYWQAAVETIREALRKSGADPAEVAALAVSSQGETTIPVDAGGQPLRNALVWLDNRAAAQAELLRAQLGAEVYDKTGIPDVIATWPACKVLWIKQNEPQVFAAAHKFLLVQDFLIYKLCGRFVSDGSISCTTLFYDIIEKRWWKKALDAVGITEERLPELLPVGAKAGSLTDAAARQLGLTNRTLVVLGGMDQAVGAIGAGNIGTGTISETTGAALAIQASIHDAMIDPSRQTPVYVHSVAGEYLFVPVCPTAGMAYKWFKDQFATEESRAAEAQGANPYEILNRLAEQVPAGSDGLIMLPHLMGAFSPESNPSARGVFSGFTLHHGKGHFVRAIQEGVAYMLRRNLELIATAGVEIVDVRTTGGGSRGKLWNQIKSDVCKLPFIPLENEDTALVGDAILAGVACGVFASVAQGVHVMVRLRQAIQPGPDAAVYEPLYQRYCELDRLMAGFFAGIIHNQPN